MIIPSGVYSSNIVYIEGGFVAIFLIVAIVASLLLPYTKYWNTYNSNTIDTCLYPTLITFVGIVIFKFMIVIQM